MKISLYLTTALFAVGLASSVNISHSAAPAARLVATSLPTDVAIPHRTPLGNVDTKGIEHSINQGRWNEQIVLQACPETIGQKPKPCSWCGGDSRIPGTCNNILISGEQHNCPPGGPYDHCLGYYCQCTSGGTDESPKVTSTTVIDGATGTVVWEPMTLTEYASLRAKTTITWTEVATATADDKEELETVVAAVFAGGVAWWIASQSGAVGAALVIPPPEKAPDGSKEDDKSCPSNPKIECKNCGGADSVGLCRSGKQAGCPCDEVQHCPNEPPLCSDAACGGDKGSSKCSANGDIHGCTCCPDDILECPDSGCGGDVSGICKSAQRKGCPCAFVAMSDGPLIDPNDPVFPSKNDLSAIAAKIFTKAWSKDYKSIPGYTATTATAPKSKSTDCSFVATVFPSSLQSIAGSGTQRFCRCGPTIAGINLAVSGTAMTSYCATGGHVPTGYTQIPAINGLPATKPSPKPAPSSQKSTTATTKPVPTNKPPPKPSTTKPCDPAWCGAPFCFPKCGPA